MNIYDFFLSPDIAIHCQNIQHSFNPLEMAVIISWSKSPLTQKIAAWQEIIDHYPDMPIHHHDCTEARDSLHEYLREVIAGEEKNKADFYSHQPEHFYQLRVWSKMRLERYGCYSTPEKAWESFLETYDLHTDKVKTADIIKVKVDCDDVGYLTMTTTGNPSYIYIEDGFHNELSSIFIHMPVPFEVGDLVELDGKPHVLQSHPHDLSFGKWKYEDFVSGAIGDGADMQAGFYYFADDGSLTWEHHSFLRLRYFRGELTGRECFLSHLSEYLKIEHTSIALPWLLHAFNATSADEGFKRLDERFCRRPKHKV